MSGEHFKELVGKIDANGDGFISPEEFENGIKANQPRLGFFLDDEQIQEAISGMDKDGDGMFSIKQVIDWMVSAGYLNKAEGLGFVLTLIGILGATAYLLSGAALTGATVGAALAINDAVTRN